MTLVAKRQPRGLSLVPAAPIGHLRDGEILDLIREEQGELRFFSSLYDHVSVIVMHQGRPRWIPLLAPSQRDACLKRLRSNQPGSICTWSRLLSCIDRAALRWYPYSFNGAAFSMNQPVQARIGERTWEGEIRGIDRCPANGYPEPIYAVRTNTHTIHALEHQLWSISI